MSTSTAPGLDARDGYYYLQAGDMIREGDEYDACNDPWRDDPVWKPVHPQSVGRKASDPAYVAHTIYRRKLRDQNAQMCREDSVKKAKPSDSAAETAPSSG